MCRLSTDNEKYQRDIPPQKKGYVAQTNRSRYLRIKFQEDNTLIEKGWKSSKVDM